MFRNIHSARRRSASRDERCARGGRFRRFTRDITASLAIAGVFWILLTLLLLFRQGMVPYRVGQLVQYDITSRVDFSYPDKELHDSDVQKAREHAPHVYQQSAQDVWTELEQELHALPDTVHGFAPQQLDPPLRDILDSAALTLLEQDRTGTDRQTYDDNVKQFIANARAHLTSGDMPLVILSADRWKSETDGASPGHILLTPPSSAADPRGMPVTPITSQMIDVSDTWSTDLPDSVLARLEKLTDGFELGLGPKIAQIARAELVAHPTFDYDEVATTAQRNQAGDRIPNQEFAPFKRTETLVNGGTVLTERLWSVLMEENQAYHDSLARDFWTKWQYRLGLSGIALVATMILCGYIVRYQPRVVRNHARATAIGGLLLSMLLLTQLAGIGSTTLYFFGIAPVVLAALILTIAYDQRFAMGMATIHAVIATVALDQSFDFFLIIWAGVLTACYLMDDIRTRSKLIEVGGVTAMAIMLVTAIVGAVQMNQLRFILFNCAYAGAAGLSAGFIALGILPFIEHWFRITTSITLLELADASQPLLRRLALEAPGTYNHSLQVASLSEAAAEAIKANSLLCRVGSYYHDIGKIKKPDYFVENQREGENRHLNLSPSLSLRIILSHVKDGVEMAKENKLPTSLLPIIQQHHGTTVVQYFYYQAKNAASAGPGDEVPSETEYRYPGPKPRSKEAAIVMLCDAVESACRAMSEPTASRLQSLVHELAMARLHDGQFDECDLNLRELSRIEQSIASSLVAIYHGRIAYPTAATGTAGTAAPSSPQKPGDPESAAVKIA